MPFPLLPSLGSPKLRIAFLNSVLLLTLLGTFAWLPAQNVGVGTATPNASLDVNGNLALRELTVAMANGANANVALPNASTVRITGPGGAFSLSGLVAPAAANGQVVVLVNGTAFGLTLQHNNAGSTAANRLALPGSTDAVVAAGGTVILSYSPTATRWQAVAITGSCGGTVAFSQTLRQDFAVNGNTTTTPSASSLDLTGTSGVAAPSCAGGIDYAGANFTPANGAVLSGTHCNINIFTVAAGTTVNVAPWNGATGGSLVIIANSIVIDGILTADGRGYGGGGGGLNDGDLGIACGAASNATGGTGGNGGNGGRPAWYSCNGFAGGGGGGSPNGAGGVAGWAPGAPGTVAGGGTGGTSQGGAPYLPGVGGPGYGGGGGGGAGWAAGGGPGGGGGTGGNQSNVLNGGNGAGPAFGAGGVGSGGNTPTSGINGGYNVANGNTDATTNLAVSMGSGGGGGGSSSNGGFGGGGGGGGAGGGSITLFGTTSVSISAAGQVLTRGGGGGQNGTYSFAAIYGGGGGGGGVALAGGTVTVAGTIDARGQQAQTLINTNGGTVKYFAGTLSVTGSVFAGRTYTGASTVYSTPGTSATQVILRNPNCAWGVLTFNTTLPSGATTLTVDVLDAAGNVLAAGVASGTNLSTLAAVTGQTSIRLRANLATGNTAQTPSLLDWRIDY